MELKVPKVSFVMPAFKASYLSEAIKSILSQSYVDFEVIVVDDCSPENIKQIVEQFSDDRLSYYRNAENIGGHDLVAAWMHALKYARGEWCVLASDDDVYAPEYLAEMMETIKRNPSVDAAHCRVAQINSEGRIVGLSEPRAEVEDAIHMLYNREIMGYKQYAQEFIFRKKTLIDNGGFVSFPLAWYSDDATWQLLASCGGVAYNSRPLFRFRCSGINITTRQDNIIPKIRAANLYYQWARALLSKQRSNNEVDQFVRKKVDGGLEGHILNHVKRMLRSANIKDWYSFLMHCDVPSSWKAACVKSWVRRSL